MAGAFSRLPVELLLMILHHVRDLPTVYNFVCASSRVNAAFELDPARIVESAFDWRHPWRRHFVRVVGLLGSLSGPNASSQPNFDLLLDKFRSLPENALLDDNPSCIFKAGTHAPRYTLLTAYRIERLKHICFATLLQNIHELVFRQDSPSPDSKQLRPGVFFDPAAWWAVSDSESQRIEQALWRLVIYWNIRAIDNELCAIDDPHYRLYSDKINSICEDLGPGDESWEVEEMNCVSAAVCEFLDNVPPFTFFTAFTGQERRDQIKKSLSRISLLLKEKFEEPSPLEDDSWCNNPASHPNFYWRPNIWESYDKQNESKADQKALWVPDYLGLCIWDQQRQEYLGLDHDFNILEQCRWRPRKSAYYLGDSYMWEQLYLKLIERLPQDQRRRLSGCEKKLRRIFGFPMPTFTD